MNPNHNTPPLSELSQYIYDLISVSFNCLYYLESIILVLYSKKYFRIVHKSKHCIHFQNVEINTYFTLEKEDKSKLPLNIVTHPKHR